MSMFKKAERRGRKIKFAVTGPAGSGKTTAAIKLARGLVGAEGRIAIIDTENGSASLYADLDKFDACDLHPPFEQRKFTNAIKDAVDAGYDVLIIDSFSHLWEAILAFKDKLDGRGGNSFMNWNKAGQEFKAVLDLILHAELHVICCMRSKTEWVLNDVSGKKVPQKLGLGVIMRDGIEFEFTTVFDLDMQHNAATSKDRTSLFDGRIVMLDEEIGEQLRDWLDGAKSIESPSTHNTAAELKLSKEEMVEEVELLWRILEKPAIAKEKAFAHIGATDAKNWEDLTPDQMDELLEMLRKQRDTLKVAIDGGRV